MEFIVFFLKFQDAKMGNEIQNKSFTDPHFL